MKTEPSFSPNSIGHAISGFFERFHVVIYTVIVIGGITVVVYLLYLTILAAIDVPINTAVPKSSFDHDTIDKLESLSEKSGGGEALKLPNTRTNPFVD